MCQFVFVAYTFQHLAEKCKNLRTVSVLGSANLTDDAFKVLAGNKKLQKIKIEGEKLFFFFFFFFSKYCLCHIFRLTLFFFIRDIVLPIMPLNMTFDLAIFCQIHVV